VIRSAADKEMYAIVWSYQEFRPYLMDNSFEVQTDCANLRWAINTKHPARIARWWSILADFDFKITYQPGTAHANADTGSRVVAPQIKP
jgi:hypothetical protein